jgi:uncharacterized protein RhaS with RHS repeats
MTDGTGTTQYSYVPPGSLGALQLQQESSPLAGSGIAYAYDALGRLASHTVQGAGAETFQYDAIGRLVTHANDLGSFTLYLGQTSQIAGRASPAARWRRPGAISTTPATGGCRQMRPFRSRPRTILWTEGGSGGLSEGPNGPSLQAIPAHRVSARAGAQKLWHLTFE